MCLHTHYDDQNYTISKLLLVSLKTASMTFVWSFITDY